METQTENDLEFNKAFIINHFEEFVNKQNSDIVYTNFAENFLDHDEAGGPSIGPEPAKKMMEAIYKNFKKLHVSVEDIIAEGDKVVVRNIWSGITHDGKKFNLKALFFGK